MGHSADEIDPLGHCPVSGANANPARRERPTEKPTTWTIGVCSDCEVQHGPHVKGCPQARFKWFTVKLIEVRRV